MKLLFTICARAGSKGVKNKNIKELNGFPLLYYTLAAYQLFCNKFTKDFDEIDIALNTDSVELREQFEKTSIQGEYIPRKKELAGDVVGKMDVIRDTLFEIENRNQSQYEYIIDLDLTSPLRTVEDINNTLQLVLKDSNSDIAYSVTDSRRSPYFNMVNRKENGYYDKVLESEFVARQQAPVCFDMNASIYVYKRDYLCDFEKKPNRNAVIWKMKDTGILDIDSEEDYELIQVIAKYLFENKDDYSEILSTIASITI